jgi:LPXTG-motif cell wall-anchored protein
MKSIFRFLGFISLFFALIIQSFAIDAPTSVAVDNTNDTSVVVTWDSVENAIMYYVYYSKQSWVDSDYENSTDLVDWTSIEINELEIWQNYYFVVTSLDENWEESMFSNEIMLDVDDTADVVTNEDFALDWVTVVSYNKIKLSFTNTLNDSEEAVREFKIVNKADSFDSFEVISSELDSEDNSVIELTLDRNLEIWTQYDVIIIAINSSTGWNIESWIDNVETFSITEINGVQVDDNTELNSVWTEETSTVTENNGWVVWDNTELNSAWTEETSLVWTNINASEIENTTLAQAEKQTALPQTWAEHILILILSIVLWAVVFIFKFKRA